MDLASAPTIEDRATMQNADNQVSRPPVSGIVWGIVLNASVPVILYKLSKRYVSPSDFWALVIASIFPLGKSVFDLVRRRQVDPVSIMVLLGIARGQPRIAFRRQRSSFARSGILIYRRVWFRLLYLAPVSASNHVLFRSLFHRGNRPAAAGAVQRRLAAAGGAFLPPAHYNRLGECFCGRANSSDILIYNTSPAMVPVISPILLGTLTTLSMVWAFSYGHRVRQRAMAELNQLLRPRVA
jgi:hypothetical protein